MTVFLYFGFYSFNIQTRSSIPSKPHIRSASFPGQTLTRLVAVSSICCHTSTSALSTSSSLRGFPAFRHWTSHLEGGFALRCLQRLSLPGSATQRCFWQSSWYTGGRPAPVLSYWGRPLSDLLRPHRIGTELSHDVLNPARVPL